MSHSYNPFQPNQPVFRGMFVGRMNEIKRTDKILYQTKHQNPTHIIYTGERGIGKSSILLVAKYFAEGKLEWEDKGHNFLTVQFSINKEMTLERFIQRFLFCLKRELRDENKIKEKIKALWTIINKFEVLGIKYGTAKDGISQTNIIDEFIYSIVDTVKSISTESIAKELGFEKERDGLVILIDEVDNANKEIGLGSLLKNLSETLVSENCNNVLIILSGLPNIHNVLAESHESALRLFEEFVLKRLSALEVKQVINRGIDVANKKLEKEYYRIDEDAIELIYFYSEGYPHFVQQICYCAFDKTADGHITKFVVQEAFFNEDGALNKIGDRYYKDLFYEKINVESYRQILSIMAENWNNWVDKKTISDKFKGNSSTLNNGIKALRDRNIILTKKGSRGQYRLQWQSFALWINRHRKIQSYSQKQ